MRFYFQIFRCSLFGVIGQAIEMEIGRAVFCQLGRLNLNPGRRLSGARDDRIVVIDRCRGHHWGWLGEPVYDLLGILRRCESPSLFLVYEYPKIEKKKN